MLRQSQKKVIISIFDEIRNLEKDARSGLATFDKAYAAWIDEQRRMFFRSNIQDIDAEDTLESIRDDIYFQRSSKIVEIQRGPLEDVLSCLLNYF